MHLINRPEMNCSMCILFYDIFFIFDNKLIHLVVSEMWYVRAYDTSTSTQKKSR